MTGLLADAEPCGAPFAVTLSAGPVTFVNSLAAGWRSAGSYRSVWRGTPLNPTLDRVRDKIRRTPWSAKLGQRLAAGPFKRFDRERGRDAERRVARA